MWSRWGTGNCSVAMTVSNFKHTHTHNISQCCSLPMEGRWACRREEFGMGIQSRTPSSDSTSTFIHWAFCTVCLNCRSQAKHNRMGSTQTQSSNLQFMMSFFVILMTVVCIKIVLITGNACHTRDHLGAKNSIQSKWVFSNHRYGGYRPDTAIPINGSLGVKHKSGCNHRGL